MKPEVAQKILEETRDNYNHIAASWDQTRQTPFINPQDILSYLKPDCQVLDVGCGNGRLMKLLENVNVAYTGIDNSQELISLAKNNFPKANFMVGDILHLPMADDSFDVVFCLSVLHHLPGQKLRKQAVSEIYRVLKPDGYVIFFNWSYCSPKMPARLINFTLKKIFRKSGLDFGDIYLGWQETEVKRYVHLFSKRGIKRLLRFEGLKVIKSYLSAATSRGYKNIVTIAKK
jgi:SAM-dependent methyltransferase